MWDKVIRLYTGPDGKSHFEEMEIPLDDNVATGRRLKEKGVTFRQSELVKATGVNFREVTGIYNLDWHNAPHRQFIITLEGEWEIEIGDGTRRRFCPGDILLVEDTTGQGHISRQVDNRPRKVVNVILD